MDTQCDTITEGRTQHFTPLIVTQLTDAQLLTHLHEFHPSQWLRQDVCKLFISAHMIHFCNPISNTLSYVMVPSVDVLSSFMIHRILAQLKC